MIYETDVIEGGSTGDCTLLQGNTLCEDLSTQICFRKGQDHSFTIEPEQNRPPPVIFTRTTQRRDHQSSELCGRGEGSADVGGGANIPGTAKDDQPSATSQTEGIGWTRAERQ